jgi:hypothetical protein
MPKKYFVLFLLITSLLIPTGWASTKKDTLYEPKSGKTETSEVRKKEIPKKKEKGRVAVVLDNSGSMAGTGTAFRDIKQSLFDALMLVPDIYASGLRVFDDAAERSRLVTPYSQDLTPLRRVLSDIEPEGGTYIGPSLLDIADDLLEKPDGDNRFLFITDGEGADSDVDAALEVKNRLTGLKGGFKCDFILFSTRRDVINETPIGRVSEILGCDLTVAGDYASAVTLTPVLLRIFGFDFYWIWIILSALAYLTLIILTSYLVFDTQYAQGMLPRIARWTSIGFVFALLPAVMGAHIIGLFSRLSGIVWGFVIVAAVILVMAAIGSTRSRKKGGRYEPNGDPFA